MSALLQDIRYALRMFRHNPGFTFVVVLTLALGIGANTAIFSVVDGVALRPLPYEKPDQLVMFWEENAKRNITHNIVAPNNYRAWREDSRSFEGIAAFTPTRMTFSGAEEPERIVGQVTTANYFALLRVLPIQGRTYTPEEDRPGAERVMVMGYAFWQRRFGGSPDAIGKTVTLSGQLYTVIGIMPEGFSFFSATPDFWLPIRLDSGPSPGRSLLAFGRLRDGVSLESAQTEMDVFARRLEQIYPELDSGWSVQLISMKEDIIGKVKPALLILLGVVGFVLLIACANVSNLLLARASTRRREMAIRVSLGAGKTRILRQTLTESVLLAGLGGIAGLLLAFWGIDTLKTLHPANIPRLDQVGVDPTALGFTLTISVITGLLFGLVPGLSAMRANPNESLKGDSRNAATTAPNRRTQNALLITEMALSIVLLTGGGLLMRSFLNLQGVDPGFTAERLLTMKIALTNTRYPEGSQRAAFFRQFVDRLKTLPGVVTASIGNAPPFTGLAPATTFWRKDQPEPASADKTVTDVRWIYPGYFTTLGAPLLNGRDLTDRDMLEKRRVVVVNETLARRMFPNENPVGKQIILSWTDRTPDEIVGVAGDVRHTGLDVGLRPMTYWPYTLESDGFMYGLVRTTVEPTGLISAIKREAQAIDPATPVYDFRLMDDLIDTTVAGRRFNLLMMGLFALVAVILAAIGLYGVMAYSVSRRTGEIGIRMALGAHPGDVMRLVLRQGMAVVGIGVAAGLALSLAATRVLSGLLYEVSPTDPVIVAGACAMLILTAFAACYLPARRATQVDPILALRNDG